MRDQWLMCMYQTLDELVSEAELRHELRQRIYAVGWRII